MRGSSTFRVTNPRALRDVTSPHSQNIAEGIAEGAAGRAPERTGRLAAGFRVEPGHAPGVWLVSISVPYFHFQEWGTRYVRPQAMLGQAIANARARYGAR